MSFVKGSADRTWVVAAADAGCGNRLRSGACGHRQYRPAQAASGGARPLVARAGAPSMQPRVLLLGEPTAALDAERRVTKALATTTVPMDFAWHDVARPLTLSGGALRSPA